MGRKRSRATPDDGKSNKFSHMLSFNRPKLLLHCPGTLLEALLLPKRWDKNNCVALLWRIPDWRCGRGNDLKDRVMSLVDPSYLKDMQFQTRFSALGTHVCLTEPTEATKWEMLPQLEVNIHDLWTSFREGLLLSQVQCWTQTKYRALWSTLQCSPSSSRSIIIRVLVVLSYSKGDDVFEQ